MQADFYDILGPNSTEILWWQVSIRAAIVFSIALVIIRLGGTRIFGKNSSFDIVLGIILGSVLSRTITGNAPFFPTLIASAFLVTLHWLLGFLSFRNSKIGNFIKGRRILLIKEGEYHWEAMKKNHITQNDILETMRLKGHIKISDVKFAYLERSGDISIVL